MEEFAFETALFDEPGGANFVAVFAMANRNAFVSGDFGGFLGKVDIVEERAGAGFLKGVGEFVSA